MEEIVKKRLPVKLRSPYSGVLVALGIAGIMLYGSKRAKATILFRKNSSRTCTRIGNRDMGMIHKVLMTARRLSQCRSNYRTFLA